MSKYPFVIKDTMDCYISFASQDDADWYYKVGPNVSLETAFNNTGIEYLKIVRNGIQVGLMYNYE